MAGSVLLITYIFNLFVKLHTSPAICKSCGPFPLKISVLHYSDSLSQFNKVDSDCKAIKCIAS